MKYITTHKPYAMEYRQQYRRIIFLNNKLTNILKLNYFIFIPFSCSI